MSKENNTINKLMTVGLDFGHKALSTQNPKIKKSLFANALKTYKKALRLDHQNHRAIQGIARTYLHQKQFSRSLDFYKRGLIVSPKIFHHIFLNGIANVYRYLGDWNKNKVVCYKKSINYYTRALKQNPNPSVSTLYWSNLSRSYAGMQDWKKATRTNEKALAILKKEKVKHGDLEKILKLENKLYKEYLKRTLL